MTILSGVILVRGIGEYLFVPDDRERAPIYFWASELRAGRVMPQRHREKRMAALDDKGRVRAVWSAERPSELILELLQRLFPAA